MNNVDENMGPIVRMIGMSWRWCSDCMPPEENADYLVSDGEIVFSTEYLGNGRWECSINEHIKYWLPLPLPPIERDRSY